MNNEIYIKLQDRKLVFLFSILEYDGLPIVFVCRDESWSLYLCDCTETRFSEQNWIVAKTEIQTLESVVDGKLSVYDALRTDGDQVILVAYDYGTKNFTQKKCIFTEVEEENLPDKDSKLLFVESKARENLCETKLRQSINRRETIIIETSEQSISFTTVAISSKIKIDFSVEGPSFDGDDRRRSAA